MAAGHWKACANKPTLLPEVLASPWISDATTVGVLSVHLKGASLKGSLSGRKYRLRVEYGERGTAASCKTRSTRLTAPHHDAKESAPQGEQALAIDESCVFLWDASRSPVIRLRLVEAGLFGRSVAEAELDFEAMLKALLNDAELRVEDLELRGVREKADIVLGNLSISIKAREASKGHLVCGLRQLGLRMQAGAVLVQGALK